MAVLLRHPKCGLEIPIGLTMPVRRCPLCGGEHYEEEFDVVEVEGNQPEIPGPPEDPYIHWAHKKWEELHRYCKDWGLKRFNEWRDSLGCGTCKAGLLQYLETEPFPFAETSEAKCLWSWELHNHVNRKLDKPEFTLLEACKLYDWALAARKEVIVPFDPPSS